MARFPMVAIAIRPEAIAKEAEYMFGMKVKGGKLELTPVQKTKLAKNLRASAANLWSSFGYHIQNKIVYAFQNHRDPTGGEKWKKLSREAIALRTNLQQQYSRKYVDSGFKGREKKVQFMPPNVKPLYLTGKLFEVATGRRLKGLHGGLGRQRAGNLGKDGIQLTIYAGYRMDSALQFGSYAWVLDGPKIRHNEGFSEYFENVLGDGTVTERAQYKVPARPYVPKFSNQFMSGWMRMNIDKRMRKWILATEKGTEQIIGEASVRGINF